MGFFSFIGNCVKAVAATAVAVVATPFVLAHEAYKAITSSSDSVRTSSQKVKQSEPAREVYQAPPTTSSSSVYYVDHTADRLREMRDPLMESARNCESACKQFVEAFFQKYDSEFEKDPEIQGYTLSRLRDRKSSIIWAIDGKITNRVSQALSLDNSETRSILGIDNYSTRKSRLDSHIDSIQRDVLQSMASNIRGDLTSLSSDIEHFVQGKVEEKERQVQTQLQALQQMERDHEQKKFDSDQAQLIPAEKLFAIQLIEEKLGA